MTNIVKNTNNDKRELLNNALRNKFGSGWILDFDESFVYYDRWDEDNNQYQTFKISYSITDKVNITIGDNPIKVARLTEFKEIRDTEDKDAAFFNKMLTFLEKNFGGSKQNTNPVIKQFDDEKMVAIEPLYIAPDEVDLHGDTLDRNDVENMVKSFNKANEEGILQSSLFHSHKTESFKVIKAWVNPCDCVIGGYDVPEGQPLAEIQFTNKKAWDLRKSGTLMGLSIGAKATVEYLDE